MTSKELKIQIAKQRSPEHWQYILSTVMKFPLLFKELQKFAFLEDDKISLRASWIMDKVTEQNHAFVSPAFIEHVSVKVVANTNYSVIRACLRLLAREELPKKNIGLLTNQCFKWLAASSSPIAVKVHAMQLLYRVTLLEPDLKNELTVLIEDQLPHGSTGFKSRGKRILKKLDTI